LLSTDGFDTVDVAPPIMSSTENNTQGARRDEQRTRFLSRENIVGNDSDAGNYGNLVATSNHLLFIADDGTHGHELHQYLRTSIRHQWMVWD